LWNLQPLHLWVDLLPFFILEGTPLSSFAAPKPGSLTLPGIAMIAIVIIRRRRPT